MQSLKQIGLAESPKVTWKGTTAVLPDSTIGLVFETGEHDICLSINLEDANHIVETIASFITDHESSILRQSAKFGGNPSEAVEVVFPHGLHRPLDKDSAAISGVLNAPKD